MRLGLVALVGWEDGSIKHPLARPFGRDGRRSICSVQKERRRNRCSRPMVPWSTATKGSGCRRA